MLRDIHSDRARSDLLKHIHSERQRSDSWKGLQRVRHTEIYIVDLVLLVILLVLGPSARVLGPSALNNLNNRNNPKS